MSPGGFGTPQQSDERKVNKYVRFMSNFYCNLFQLSICCQFLTNCGFMIFKKGDCLKTLIRFLCSATVKCILCVLIREGLPTLAYCIHHGSVFDSTSEDWFCSLMYCALWCLYFRQGREYRILYLWLWQRL